MNFKVYRYKVQIKTLSRNYLCLLYMFVCKDPPLKPLTLSNHVIYKNLIYLLTYIDPI